MKTEYHRKDGDKMHRGLRLSDKQKLEEIKNIGGTTYSLWEEINGEWEHLFTVNIEEALREIEWFERELEKK